MKDFFNHSRMLLAIIFISTLASCNEENNRLSNTKVEKNITIIFGERSYKKDTLRFIGGGFSPTNNLIKISKASYVIFENYIPKNQHKSDTLVLYTSDEDITIEHKYHYYHSSIYQFKPDDTVKIDYVDGVPMLKIINRNVSDFDLNYQTTLNLSYPKPISNNEFYLNNKRFRTKKEINAYNKLRLEIEKKRISAIDSMKDKGLITENTKTLVGTLHKYTNPHLFFENYDSKLGLDSLLNISSYRSFLTNYSIYKFKIGTVKLSKHENEIDYLSLFDSILKNKSLYTKKTKEYLLTTTLKSISNYSSLKEFNKYYDLFESQVQDTILINDIKNTFLVELNDLKLETSNIHLINNKNEKFLFSEILKEDKIVYVDFWASWCAPCRQEMPEAIKITKEYDTKMTYLYISIDKNAENWRKAVLEEGLINNKNSYLAINYPNAEFYKEISLNVIPRYLLFKNGKLIHKNAPSPSSDEINNLINNTLLVDEARQFN